MLHIDEALPVGHLHPNPDWYMAEHQHRHHETLVILSGRLHVRLGGERLSAGPGTVLLYRAGVPHEEHSDAVDPCDFYFFGWRGRADDVPVMVHDDNGRLRTLLNWCEHDLRQGQRDRYQEYMRCFQLEWQHRIDRPAADEDVVQRVLAWCLAHITEAITLDDLADVAEMSKFHFLRRWKRWRGRTPMQDLRLLRVERARRLLMTTEQPIKAIPEQVGVANEYHLSRLFRQLLGQPPGYFRRRH